MVKTWRMTLLPCLLMLLLPACSATDPEWMGSASGAGLLGDAPPLLNPFRGAQGGGGIGAERTRPRGYIDSGREGGPRRSASTSTSGAEPGDIELNFVNVEVQEFVRVAFDEILKEPVVIDPSIQGRVTVRTPGPVSKRAALDIVRAALETQGLQMGKTGATYRIAGRGGASGTQGGHVRFLNLNSISAEQAKAALQPFTNGQVQLSGSGDGRSLLMSGPTSDVEGLAQLAGALDVDQMRAVSFALLPLREASATAVSSELNQMFGAREGQGFKAIPIQRVNGVLITTRSKETLERARSWVRKLDQTGKDTRRVNVYQLQNRRANEVAQILQGMFGQSSAQNPRAASPRPPIAPGLTPSLSSNSNPTGQAQGGVARLASIGGTASLAPGSEQGGLSSTGGYAEPPVSPAEATVPLGVQTSEAEAAPVSIRADTATNSIVVVSKPDDYRIVESAIRRLDVLPSQVLIEATIVEVGLNDALRHGVRWFLQNGNHGGSLTDSATGSFSNVYPGFNYTFSAGNAHLVVNALEKITDVEIVSSPALTVLDNQPATLKIGDQVPVATRSARSVINPDAPTVNEIEMKDTGIILQVIPRVNSSGLVMLDISQEASDVVPTTSSAIDSPTIRQRKINSSVAVQSGSEIVLGGIISRRKTKSKEGVPGLMHIPVLGNAFTSLGKNERERTELMVIIRPTVVNSRQDLQILTQEIKSRMAGANMALYR